MNRIQLKSYCKHLMVADIFSILGKISHFFLEFIFGMIHLLHKNCEQKLSKNFREKELSAGYRIDLLRAIYFQLLRSWK